MSSADAKALIGTVARTIRDRLPIPASTLERDAITELRTIASSVPKAGDGYGVTVEDLIGQAQRFLDGRGLR